MNEPKRDAITYLAYFVMLLSAAVAMAMLALLALGPVKDGCAAELAFWRSLVVLGVTLALGGRVVSWW